MSVMLCDCSLCIYLSMDLFGVVCYRFDCVCKLFVE